MTYWFIAFFPWYQVSIKEFGTQFEFARLRLLHVSNLKSNAEQQKLRNSLNETSKSKIEKDENGEEKLILKSSDVATFEVDIVAPEKEGTYHGQVFLKTLYEVR